VFTFVRNPWDRLHSAYRFLRKGGVNEWDRRFFDANLAQFSDFNDFVHKWVNPRNVWGFVHFYPQWYFVYEPCGRKLVDYVGRYESIDSDFRHVAESIGRPSARLTPRNVTGPRMSYQETYDHESRRIVEQVYRRDIEIFGYAF